MPLMRGRPASALIMPRDQQQQIGGGGGTGYPGSLQDMRRVPPMAGHYPGGQFEPQFGAHTMHAGMNGGGMMGPPQFGQRQMQYDAQPRYGLVPRPSPATQMWSNNANRMNSMSAIGAQGYPNQVNGFGGQTGPPPAPKPQQPGMGGAGMHQPAPAVSYRYGPSGYPPKSDLPKRNATLPNQNPASVLRSQIEEQEERLQRLKVEESKRHQELRVAHEAEKQLLQAARTRQLMEDFADEPSHVVAHEPRFPAALANLDLLTHMQHNGLSTSEKDVPPPLPKSPPPLAAGPKKVSWSDAPAKSADSPPPQLHTQSSFTLQDIDEVLGTSGEPEAGASLAMANTPNVIGAQEVYKDPRERIKLEKLRAQPSKVIPVPEKLSFKEKMKFFAMEADQQGDKLKNSKSADNVPVCFE